MLQIPLFTGPSDTGSLREYLNQLIVLINSGILVPAGLQLYAREKTVATPAQAVVEVPYTQYVVDLTAPQALNFDLPDVDEWLETYNSAIPLIFKDGAGAAGANNITITPAFGQTIDSLSLWTIAADWGALAIRPREDGSGWWVT